MLKRYRIRDYDFKLILLIIAITVIGILSVGSAEEAVQNKQILGFIMGMFLMIVLSLFDYSFFLKLHWIIYIGNLMLLGFVQLFGKTAGGAQRWVEIAGIRFQPSETAKIMLILFFAQYIMKHKDTLNTFRTLASLVLLLAPPLVLIYKQPALSTSIVVALIFCTIVFVGGLNYKIVVGILAVVIPVLLSF